MAAVLVLVAIAAVAIAYVVMRSRSDHAAELVAAMSAHAKRQRADMEARAARVEELVERGDVDDAAVAASHMLLELLLPERRAYSDVAAVRALSAIAVAYGDREAGNDLGRTLDAFEGNRDRLGREATALAIARLEALAMSLAVRGHAALAERTRAVCAGLATRCPGSAT